MRKGLCIALAAMATLVLSCTSSHAARSPSDTATSAAELAREDGAPDVAPYREALAKLDALCTQDQAWLARIVDDTFRTEVKQSAHDRYHWDRSRLDVLRGIRDDVPRPRHHTATDPPSNCWEIEAIHLHNPMNDE